MTKRTERIALVFISALGIAGGALAHEGPHKVMGTVSSVNEHRIEVKATTGKVVSIDIDGKTKVLHGATAMKVSDIKIGERIVVTAMEKKGSDGKATLTASEIRLAAP